ncbi:hypothetical protein HDU90_007045 [Geranomyces variabilis]|nr:hypothetical protein HDU90_007045 [Geranomyces variabilis]
MEHSTLAPWLLSYPPTATTDINDESSSGAFQPQQQQQPRRHRHRTSNTTGTTSTRLSERRAAATLLQTSAELAVFLSGGVNYHDEECDEDEADARNDDGLGDDFDADNDNDDDYGVNILPGLLLANRHNGGSNGDDDDVDDDNEELLPTLQTVDLLRDRIRGDLSTVRSELDSLQSWYQQYSERIASAVLAGFFGNGRRARGGGGDDNDSASSSARQPAATTRRAMARQGETVSGDAANHAGASSFLRQPPPPPPPPPPQQQQQRSSYQQREDRAIRMAIPIEWADLPDIPLRRFGISPTFASSLSSSATTRRATRRANRRAQQQLQDSQLSRQSSSSQQQQSHYAQLLTADGDLWTTEHETTYTNAILTPNETQQQHPALLGSGGCILSGGHLWTPNLFYERRPACCRAHAAAVVLDGLDADGNDVCQRMREESGVGGQDRSLFFCDVQDWSVGAAGLMSVLMARQGGEVVGR